MMRSTRAPGSRSSPKSNRGVLSRCRICGAQTLKKFLSLGPSPLANNFLTTEQLRRREPYFPLDVCVCTTCWLVQLADVVPPETMFAQYLYLTGASPPMRLHFAGLAADLVRRFSPPRASLIIDVGSNDGTFLEQAQAHGLRGLGVEPAANVVAVAEARGVETLNAFFNMEVAERIVRDKGPARAVVATNVFAHVHDLDGFTAAVVRLLAEDGVFVIEVPYVVDMLDRLEFDTIYHEHLSYFGVRPLSLLFERFGLQVTHVSRLKVHGGSIRVYVQRSPGPPPSRAVSELVAKETAEGFGTSDTYQRFAQRVQALKDELVGLLRQLKAQGAKIVGYGAPAKGNTLLNFCKIGTEILDYVIDTTPFKHGRYTPGLHLPVLPEARFQSDRPDYALLLAWNYAEEILKKEGVYRAQGGKFIMPIPHPAVI